MTSDNVSRLKLTFFCASIGEHTWITHAWISAALHSAIRGVVMILVEHGHVDEAKEIVNHWNETWMKI
jgi:hypothetical protein